MVGTGFLTGADGCGPQRPIPVPTAGIPMGYEQGASADKGDDDDIVCEGNRVVVVTIVCEGNRVVVVTIVVALLGVRACVIGHEDEGEGAQRQG